MKKNVLALLCILLLFIAVATGIDIQSVEEFYGEQTKEESTEADWAIGQVTITIRCDTILDNYDDLDEALKSEEFVPEDGVILAESVYAIYGDETVFDILLQAAKEHGIQMEYQGSQDNNFGTVYIQGIANIYEYSCGPLSGWTYRVNGIIPDYGCSQYVLQDGDVIEWLYTCDLGRDVGAEFTEE